MLQLHLKLETLNPTPQNRIGQGLPFTILEDAAIAPYITLLKEEELAVPEPIEADEAADAAQAAADGGAAAAAAAADEGVPVVPPAAGEGEGPAPMME